MPRILDLTGRRFSRLTALRFHDIILMPSTQMRRWWCRCDCGAELPVTVGALRGGNTKSCGCQKIDSSRDRMTTHGKAKSQTYVIWQGMLRRFETTKEAAAARETAMRERGFNPNHGASRT